MLHTCKIVSYCKSAIYLSHISFLDFLGEIMMFLQEYDVIIWGFLPKLGNPFENLQFCFRMCIRMGISDTLTVTNNTCFVEIFIKNRFLNTHHLLTPTPTNPLHPIHTHSNNIHIDCIQWPPHMNPHP